VKLFHKDSHLAMEEYTIIDWTDSKPEMCLQKLPIDCSSSACLRQSRLYSSTKK